MDLPKRRGLETQIKPLSANNLEFLNLPYILLRFHKGHSNTETNVVRLKKRRERGALWEKQNGLCQRILLQRLELLQIVKMKYLW